MARKGREGQRGKDSEVMTARKGQVRTTRKGARKGRKGQRGKDSEVRTARK